MVDYLKSQGNGVGKSTVYRYLEKLVEEGKVRKYFLEEGAGACFQLAGGDENCCKHYHLKCVRCGALLHVECSFLDQVHAHILQQHQFQIDSRKTVLYGLCEQCRETGERRAGMKIRTIALLLCLCLLQLGSYPAAARCPPRRMTQSRRLLPPYFHNMISCPSAMRDRAEITLLLPPGVESHSL